LIVLPVKERVNVTGVWDPTWVTLAGRLPQLHSFGHISIKIDCSQFSREQLAALSPSREIEAFSATAIPFATPIVTVLGSPKAEPAQPRALIGGHLTSTFVGSLIVKFFDPGPWAAALTVGLALVAMHPTGTFHPPPGIDPLVVVVVNDMSWDFLVTLVGIRVMLLALFAFAWHNLVARGANRGVIPCQQGGGELCDRPIPKSLLSPAVLRSPHHARYLPQRVGASDGTEFDLRTLLPHDGIVSDRFMSVTTVAEAIEPPFRE
jgi:hypothetical protein